MAGREESTASRKRRLAIRPTARHDGRCMGRRVSEGSFAWLAAFAALAACTGDPLSAGSNDPTSDSGAPAAAPVAITRATLTSMIDTFAMDETNLYFTSEDGSLYRLAKTGSEAPVVLASATTPGSVYTEGLAVDATNLYWTALGDGISTGVVLSVGKTGGSAVALAMNLPRPDSIAVDDTTVYWSNQGAPLSGQGENDLSPQQGSIMSVPKGGGAATVLTVDMATPDEMTLDPTGVVWHDKQAISRIAKTGGATTTLTSAAIPWTSSNLVVSGTTLYWAANQSGWSVQSVPLAGGATTTLTSIEAPGAILAVESSIFWNVEGGTHVGAIKAELGGSDSVLQSPPDIVAGSTAEQASFFLADATAFYWVEYWESPALTVAIRILSR